MNANENAIDDGLWIHRYTKCYSRKAISPLPLSSPFSSIQRIESSTWKRMDRVQGGQLRRAIQAWSGIIVVALEPIAVVYISYQKQRIFLRGVSSASRLIVASTSYRSREIDVDVLNDSLEKERERRKRKRKKGNRLEIARRVHFFVNILAKLINWDSSVIRILLESIYIFVQRSWNSLLQNWKKKEEYCLIGCIVYII